MFLCCAAIRVRLYHALNEQRTNFRGHRGFIYGFLLFFFLSFFLFFGLLLLRKARAGQKKETRGSEYVRAGWRCIRWPSAGRCSRTAA